MGGGGVKTNLNKKVGRSRQIIIILFYNLRPDDFFSNGRVMQQGGDDQGQLKKFRQVGHMRGFNKYF